MLTAVFNGVILTSSISKKLNSMKIIPFLTLILIILSIIIPLKHELSKHN